jgi:hypothetical protein
MHGGLICTSKSLTFSRQSNVYDVKMILPGDRPLAGSGIPAWIVLKTQRDAKKDKLEQNTANVHH